ncbi:hypothetical protein [Neobacillus niacini]|uniref:hypothetical protein n=1 Tax=Neobacillus niacini TaxID=86668 RepID=UPI00203AB910|nr:hypothetical protein [Neobacillus niacini]MCM3692177.1 hypothetical protein [Neobacillus niacini]
MENNKLKKILDIYNIERTDIVRENLLKDETYLKFREDYRKKAKEENLSDELVENGLLSDLYVSAYRTVIIQKSIEDKLARNK